MQGHMYSSTAPIMLLDRPPVALCLLVCVGCFGLPLYPVYSLLGPLAAAAVVAAAVCDECASQRMHA